MNNQLYEETIAKENWADATFRFVYFFNILISVPSFVQTHKNPIKGDKLGIPYLVHFFFF